ncbi:hypothetical protein ACFP81_05735 [Deinococcus lacus]|uniref:Secreted protein n=1 Tax=Deinococcus lacus TaxID=392561 RepID=A0ABW1YDE0_9DEIO
MPGRQKRFFLLGFGAGHLLPGRGGVLLKLANLALKVFEPHIHLFQLVVKRILLGTGGAERFRQLAFLVAEAVQL